MSEKEKKVLRSMMELEVLLRQRQIDKIKESLDADQSDIEVAFEADGLSFSDPDKAGTMP